MKEKDPWIKNFRQRMEGYEEPVPADLWGQLEQELQPGPHLLPWYRRWQAAAAVGLVLLASVLTVWFWQSPSARYLQQQSADWQEEPVGRSDEGWLAVDESLAKETFRKPSSTVQTPVIEKLVNETPVIETPVIEKFVNETVVVGTADIETVVRDAATREAVDSQVAASAAGDAGREETVRPAAVRPAVRSGYAANRSAGVRKPRRRQHERGWSVGFSAANGALASTTRSAGYLPLPRGTQGVLLNNAYGVQTLSEIDKLVQFKNLSEGKDAQSDVKYHLPVVIGASLRVDWNEQWALETGLTYTKLVSETRSGTAKNHYGWEDRLHYVGIPVKVHRRLWSSRRFEVYASAGGAVEKCVSGKRTLMGSVSTLAGGPEEKVSGSREDLEVDPLQWSLSAAAGVQFKLNRQWGVYAEPGVAYFFDDGSDVATVRKEHPFQFHFQVGLRFTLPR